MGTEFEKGNAQENSSFFTKLPPELRRQIFIYLFGESIVHIKFHQSKDQFKREGRPKPSKVPGWCHCVCRKGKEACAHPHSEEDHKWCYLSANVMFTCKWAFQSGLHVLYALGLPPSKTIYVDFQQLAALMPHTSLKEKLEVRIDVDHFVSNDDGADFVSDVADKMLDEVKVFLYALNQSSVSMFDLCLPEIWEPFVEGEKEGD
ncbi:hypothetical protein FDENT_11334 [Fusarium denticulatum]|uniref:DUF7730 domain-containing protein n=1 Tax=Fusarium denticulatum TaxID=48507 RepID=A0A8H5TKW3_9HYPO|nr:hypothetical protein FDENT_11334 [Fusarium denticulatum]